MHKHIHWITLVIGFVLGTFFGNTLMGWVMGLFNRG
jgi:hypothetical protein